MKANKEYILKLLKLNSHKIKRLESLIKKVKQEDEDLINENRAFIKQNIMPKKGEIYKLNDDFDRQWEISENAGQGYYRTATKNNQELDLKYAQITNDRLETYRCLKNGNLNVKVVFLNSNFEIIKGIDSWKYDHLEICHLSEKINTKELAKHKTQVYLMIDKNTGLYKIGRSKKPEFREKTLQSEKPTIELLFNWHAFNKDELNLHKIFEEKRIRGEWFDLNYSDIDTIKNYFQEKHEQLN